MRLPMIGALAAALAFAGQARAAEADPEYSADEFVRAILSGPRPCPPGQTLEACEANPKTRRFSLASPAAAPPPATPAASRPASVPPRPRKVSSSNVLVTFDTGSAVLTPQGQANLRSVAAGLAKPALAAVNFEIAGFTDATGARASNLELSRRRAEAVKAYLVAHEVGDERLVTAGYGPDHLADPSEPASEANRRVELHRLN